MILVNLIEASADLNCLFREGKVRSREVVNSARVNSSSIESDALMNSGRSIMSTQYRCIVARSSGATTSSLYLDMVVSLYLDVVVFRVRRGG